jgi:putative transposase
MSTYSQIYLHIIFAVKRRQNLIDPSWEDDLFKYISGIIHFKNQKLIAINGSTDHIHILIGIKPACCLSDLVREIKKSSSVFINERNLSRETFHWQNGFGAFSCSHSQLNNVIRYIANQKEHHRTKTTKEEYVELLERFNVDYNERYLFDGEG